MHRDGSLGFFVVFEPSYALGCLARKFLGPTRIGFRCRRILMREQHRSAAGDVLGIGGARVLATNYAAIAPVNMVTSDRRKMQQHQSQAALIAEVLFRLYYFDFVTNYREYVIYLDLDMLILGDILAIRQEFSAPALLHAVEAELTTPSRLAMPPHITRYLNSGFLAFEATDIKILRQTLHKAQSVVEEIAATALYA